MIFLDKFAWLCLMLTASALADSAPEKPDLSTIGREAQQLGRRQAQSLLQFQKQQAEKVGKNEESFSTDSLLLPELKEGAFSQGDQTLEVNKLFPGTNTDHSTRADTYFPDGQVPDVTALRQQHTSEKRAEDQGNTTGKALQAELDRVGAEGQVSHQTAVWQSAYRDSKRNRPAQLTRNDVELMRTSREVYGKDLFQDAFTDCEENTTFRPTQLLKKAPDLHHCSRVIDQSGECEVKHYYDAGLIRHHAGPMNLDIHKSSMNLWIGKVGDNYWGCKKCCKVFEEWTQVRVLNPAAITRAVLERAEWDDHMQVWVGPQGQEEKVWQGPYDHFPEFGRCELNKSWKKSPNVDITRFFHSVQPGSVVSFKIRVAVDSGNSRRGGEGYGRVRIDYDSARLLTQDNWGPEDCLEQAAINDGFASGGGQCLEMPENDHGCLTLNGLRVCESHFKPSPVPGVSPLCRRASRSVDVNFYVGQADCYTDVHGRRQCPHGEKNVHLDRCDPYKHCAFVGSQCIDGAQGRSGACYAYQDTYDCGTTVPVTSLKKERQLDCLGPVRCMGGDCLDLAGSEDQTENFARAAALLNALQMMGQDINCLGVDNNGQPTGDENVTCSVFGGEPRTCKTVLSGHVHDCCDCPTGFGLALHEYLVLMMGIPKLDTAILNLDRGNVVRSSYQLLREPVVNGWKTLTKPFTSAMDSTMATVKNVTRPITEVVSNTLSSLKEKLAGMMNKLFSTTAESWGTVGADAVAEGVDKASGQVDKAGQTLTQRLLGETGASVLGNVMMVYTVYTLTITALKLLYPCEKDEYELSAKRELKSCHYIGSYCDSELGICISKKDAYCCFSSPLSLILQEQIRGTQASAVGLSPTFGTAKRPDCGGIPVLQLVNIDWSQIDLDKWTAMLAQNNLWPDQHTINIDTLTGNLGGLGKHLDELDGQRQNVQERTMERMTITPDVDSTLETLEAQRRQQDGTQTAPP